MNNSSKLDLRKLENVRQKGGKLIGRCPACAEAGSDTDGDNLVLFKNGNYACAANQGDKEHSRRIWQIAGSEGSFDKTDIVFKETRPKPKAKEQTGWGDLADAIKAAKRNIGPIESERIHHYGFDFVVVRFEQELEGKRSKTIRPFHKSAETGWRWVMQEPGVTPLYNLTDIESRPGELVVYHEGEKCCDHFASIGYISTTNCRGSGNDLSNVDMLPLAGRDIVVIADNDEPGLKHARKVAEALSKLEPPASVRIIDKMPGVAAKGDAFDWIKLRNEAGKDASQMRAEFDELVANATRGKLPPLKCASTWMHERDLPPKPPEIIEGVLHQGSKMIIGAPSKARKSFSLLDMAIAVATGADWWGFRTRKGRVAFLNFELQEPFLADRIFRIASHKGVIADNLFTMTFRGTTEPVNNIVADLIPLINATGPYSLIVVDPFYKLNGERDEKQVGEVMNVLTQIEKLAVKTDAAVVIAHHFAKGNAAEKESIDRMSGSGAFGRDPDAIVTMTPHEADDCFSVEPILRNFAPVDPFVVRWDYPVFEREADLNPKDLRKPAKRDEKQEPSPEEFKALVPNQGTIHKAVLLESARGKGFTYRGAERTLARLIGGHELHEWNVKWNRSHRTEISRHPQQGIAA